MEPEDSKLANKKKKDSWVGKKKRGMASTTVGYAVVENVLDAETKLLIKVCRGIFILDSRLRLFVKWSQLPQTRKMRSKLKKTSTPLPPKLAFSFKYVLALLQILTS
jgi:hypothetical protein